MVNWPSVRPRCRTSTTDVVGGVVRRKTARWTSRSAGRSWSAVTATAPVRATKSALSRAVLGGRRSSASTVTPSADQGTGWPATTKPARAQEEWSAWGRTPRVGEGLRISEPSQCLIERHIEFLHRGRAGPILTDQAPGRAGDAEAERPERLVEDAAHAPQRQQQAGERRRFGGVQQLEREQGVQRGDGVDGGDAGGDKPPPGPAPRGGAAAGR